MKRFDPLTFLAASVIAAVLLVPLVIIPQLLSKNARLEVLRGHVGELSKMAASVIDGDLHQKLLDSRNLSTELYAKAIAPLVLLHSANPDIYYLYTMVEKDGAAYFVLDTANSPELQTDKPLEASAYLEKFGPDKSDDWLDQLRHGRTYITPNFEQDDYGTFLSGHTPIYDSEGRYSGFVGVDVDLGYNVARESRFLIIAAGTIVVALLLSLAFGYGAAIYLSAMRNRLQELYQSSATDSTTGPR